MIPSFKEDPRVVRQALWSAALQRYPNRRVVLLIDDPPYPNDPQDWETLTASRLLPREIQAILETQAERFEPLRREFLEKKSSHDLNLKVLYLELSQSYHEVADWFEAQAESFPSLDHTDRLFVQVTFRENAAFYRHKAQDFYLLANESPGSLSLPEIEREWNQIASIFRVSLSSFERKRYENCSHEPNKAMNLNSYIALLGKSWKEVDRHDNLCLEPPEAGEGAMTIPDSDYLITLDADSFLESDYASRLIHVMESPGNKDLAVVQTPYSAVPDTSRLLERIAGATTDMQYLIHQGFAADEGTYWVGANALLRKRALEDIKQEKEERGFRVTKYIQDRTVIEDTESTVDLIDRGWRLYNYPERRSYSATPPDFGALIIQRHRWANGGLLILPKLIRYFFRGPFSLTKIKEAFLRVHYLTSVTGVNLGVLLLLLYPFEENLRSLWLPLTAFPYYFFYGRDLLQAGYRLSDLGCVYILNLMLIPINLGGVFASLKQAVMGRKSPFKRTPKVTGRTMAPRRYLLAEYAILFYGLIASLGDFFFARWFHLGFSLFTTSCFAYALVRFIGVKEAWSDLFERQKTVLPCEKQESLPAAETLSRD